MCYSKVYQRCKLKAQKLFFNYGCSKLLLRIKICEGYPQIFTTMASLTPLLWCAWNLHRNGTGAAQVRPSSKHLVHQRQIMCFAVHLFSHISAQARRHNQDRIINQKVLLLRPEELLARSPEHLVLQSHYRCITIYNVRRDASVYSVCGLFAGSKTSLGAADMDLH